MRAILAVLSFLAFAAGTALAAQAEGKPVVIVELFTSQGCSSCPPADEMLTELADRDDILPLALHVDYWDYIGWADTFARPENTSRQKAYARAAGQRSIYTPEMVVAGVDHVLGNRPMQLAERLMAHKEAMGSVTIDAAMTGNRVSVRAMAGEGADLPARMVVDLVVFRVSGAVEITRGENAGRTIQYANIVERWDRLGQWDGDGAWEGDAQLPDEGAAAVIVQQVGPGPILAAIRLR